MKSAFLLLSQFIGQFSCFNFDDCGVTTSCMTLPDACTPSKTSTANSTACTVISWRTEENGISVSIYGENTTNPGDWVGVGFSKTDGMKTSDIYLCKRLGEDVKFVSAYSTTEAPPIEYPTTNNSAPGIVNGTIGTVRSDYSFICNFMVNQTVTKESETFNYVKNVTYHILVARGILTDWTTTYHKERQSSKQAIQFFPGEKHIFINGNAKVSAMIKSHAAMMFIAWALLAPIR